MDDISAPRIEPAAGRTDLGDGSLTGGQSRKRPAPEKAPSPEPPSPLVDSGDPVEELHQIDELA